MKCLESNIIQYRITNQIYFVISNINLYLSVKLQIMATKKKAGRPKVKDPIKVRYVYLNNGQVAKVIAGTGEKDLTKAILKKCG